MIQPAVSVTTTVLANDTFSEINPILVEWTACAATSERKDTSMNIYAAVEVSIQSREPLLTLSL